MFNIELEYCHSLQNVPRGSISSSQMSDTIHCSVSCVECLELTFTHVTPLNFSSYQEASSLHAALLPGLGREDVVLCQLYFYRFTRDSCSGKSQPGPAGRQSWILDHDEWMTFLGEQSHSRIDNNNSVSLCCSGWAAAVNSAYFAAISNPRIIVRRSRYLFALLIFSHYP